MNPEKLHSTFATAYLTKYITPHVQQTGWILVKFISLQLLAILIEHEVLELASLTLGIKFGHDSYEICRTNVNHMKCMNYNWHFQFILPSMHSKLD